MCLKVKVEERSQQTQRVQTRLCVTRYTTRVHTIQSASNHRHRSVEPPDSNRLRAVPIVVLREVWLHFLNGARQKFCCSISMARRTSVTFRPPKMPATSPASSSLLLSRA